MLADTCIIATWRRCCWAAAWRRRTAEVLARHGIHHPFVVCDENTRRVAMAQVEASLKAADMPYVVCSLGEGHIEPDEARWVR